MIKPQSQCRRLLRSCGCFLWQSDCPQVQGVCALAARGYRIPAVRHTCDVVLQQIKVQTRRPRVPVMSMARLYYSRCRFTFVFAILAEMESREYESFDDPPVMFNPASSQQMRPPRTAVAQHKKVPQWYRLEHTRPVRPRQFAPVACRVRAAQPFPFLRTQYGSIEGNPRK